MKYGILDFGTITANSNAISTIHETIEMVQLAESLGFTRYWLSEHHEDMVAWKNPDIVLPLLAGYTNTIKIGAAGVLLGLHPPMTIAYHYKLLENLYPGRIDLGLAKGSTVSYKCIELTDGANWEENLKDYKTRLKRVKSLINDEVENIILPPCKGNSPEIWALSTSDSMIEFIIQEKLNFSLSLFHTLDNIPSKNIIPELRKKYYERHGMQPRVNIAITAFCSDDKSRIEEIKINTKNVTLNYAGNAEKFVEYIEKLGDAYDVDEIIIVNMGVTTEEKLNLMYAFQKQTVEK